MLRQKDHEFKASLGNLARLFQKKKKKIYIYILDCILKTKEDTILWISGGPTEVILAGRELVILKPRRVPGWPPVCCVMKVRSLPHSRCQFLFKRERRGWLSSETLLRFIGSILPASFAVSRFSLGAIVLACFLTLKLLMFRAFFVIEAVLFL
jgi:hypothetical protein